MIVLLGFLIVALPLSPVRLMGGDVPCPQVGGGGLLNIVPAVSGCPGAMVGPSAAFTYDSCIARGCTVVGFPMNFNASWSASTKGTVVLYTWDFGDGSTAVQTTKPTISYNYLMGCPNPTCNVNVTLTVGDSTGMTNTIVQTISLNMVPQFEFQPSSPETGQSITFNGTASQSTSFSWSFGDDTSGSGAGVAHTYSTPGLYRVILTAVAPSANGPGAIGQVSKTILVRPDPPSNPGGLGGSGRIPM